MDQVSRIRLKNLLDRLLRYCDEANAEDERAVLLRIGVVVLNKLRIHADVGLGFEVRALNKQIGKCKTREQLMSVWDNTTELIHSYMLELA